MANILIVEDEAPIAALVSDHLTRRGHSVTSLEDGEAALCWLGLGQSGAAQAMPDLVVLDVMLPGRSGLELCTRIRCARAVRQPIILMLTAKRTEEDAIAGFEVGADDYVRKPFGVGELVRRIDALLALASGRAPGPRLDTALLRIDPDARQVHVGSEEVHLTPKEYELLAYLVANVGVVVRRDRLLDEVWGYSHAGYARTVDSHVRRIRRKLEAAGLLREPIATVHGVGYRFEVE